MGKDRRMARTLAGHLDDLDLDEVVRVISLSKRAGVLALETPEGNAELFFLGGKVVSARLYDHHETVAELLMTNDILEPGDLPTEGSPTLDDVLREAAQRRAMFDDEDAHTLPARADALLKEQLEGAVKRVLEFKTGRFSFQVTEDDSPPPRYPQDTAYTVADGVDALGIAKRRRERRARDPKAAYRSPQGAPEQAETPSELFLVDDDDAFLGHMDRHIQETGVSLRSLGGARAALDALDELEVELPKRLMVVDLVMPRSDGRGILGGLEILREASERGCADRIFIALDNPHEDATQMSTLMGAAGVLDKPRKNGAMKGVAPFLNPILEALGRELIVDKPVDIVDALREELGGDEADDWQRAQAEAPEKGRSLSVLKDLLSELNDPSFEEEIPLLVLRFASAFFSRGALFHVNEPDGELAGIGGFGISADDAGRAVHAIKIPLAADTLFTRALRERRGVRQPFFESEWNGHLLGCIGGPRPKEVWTAPIISARGVEAVLFADNALDQRAFPDTSLLEIFLQQSGAAIERWGLKTKLAELAGGSF
jgi:CheY-like chemotaxis protein